MKLLLDTHLLLWTALAPARLSPAALGMLADASHELFFSAANIWEIAIKNGLGRPDFQVPPRILRRALLDNGYQELRISGDHAVAIDTLAPLHKDPFGRMLIAQATVEGMTLLTSDAQLAAYRGPVQLV